MSVGHALLVFATLSVGACAGDAREAADMSPEFRIASAPVPSNASTSAPPAAASLARATFDVEGMTCAGCVLGTRKALSKLPGVRAADASYDEITGKGQAWAEYDPALVTPERMMAAIRELGYKPTPAQS